MTRALLEARGVRVELAGRVIVEHADLQLVRGTVTAIVGPNGAGKSTLARAVVGLQRAAAGTITWSGRPLGAWRRRELARTRAFVPQRAPVSPGLTVRDVIAMGRAPHLGPLQRPTAKDAAIVSHAIARGGVGHLTERRLVTLSGGELQRVRLAVALAQETPAIVLDEPTASLDLGAAAEMGRLLRGLATQGLAILVVVHDLALAAATADEIVVVDRGRTVACGAPVDVLTPERLRSTWGAIASLEVGTGSTVFDVDWFASGGSPACAADAPKGELA